MAANTEPIFPMTPVVGMVVASTGNSNRDGTGTLADVITGATNGTRISRITIIATGTSTAGMMRLYIYNTTDNRLWKEIPVTAVTPSGTLQCFVYVLSLYGEDALILPYNYKLKAAPHNSESFNVIAEGGNY